MAKEMTEREAFERIQKVKEQRRASDSDLVRIRDELEKGSIARNKTTLSEMQKFDLLFQPPNPNIDTSVYKSLSDEFSMRFNLYAPITVVDSVDSKKPTVLKIIPPMFGPIKTLNKVNGGDRACSHLHSALAVSDNPLRNDTEIAVAKVITAVNKADDTETIQRQKKIWQNDVGLSEAEVDDKPLTSDMFDWK